MSSTAGAIQPRHGRHAHGLFLSTSELARRALRIASCHGCRQHALLVRSDAAPSDRRIDCSGSKRLPTPARAYVLPTAPLTAMRQAPTQRAEVSPQIPHMSTLRNIALTVAEPKPGVYKWRLLEAYPEHPSSWLPLHEATADYREWIDALNEGIDQVMILAIDGQTALVASRFPQLS